MVEQSAKMIIAARTVGKEAVITKEEIDMINNLEIEQYKKKTVEGKSIKERKIRCLFLRIAM